MDELAWGYEEDDFVAPRKQALPTSYCTGPSDCSPPRFVAVADGIQATVFDTRRHRDLFPTTTGNRSDECGFGTAKWIAEALNFYEANASLTLSGKEMDT
jgi:hypothetical protein